MSIVSILTSLRISTKIISAFGLILFVMLGISLAAINRLSAVNEQAAEVRGNWLPSTGALGQLLASLRDLRVAEARFIGADNEAERQQTTAEATTRRQTVERLRAAYEPLITRGTADETFMQAFDASWAEQKQLETKYLGVSSANPHELFSETNRKVYLKAASALQSDLDFNVAEGKKEADRSDAVYTATKLS